METKMKMIDEKGRLFGRINVIDFLVILFLLCFIPAFYFAYKIFNKPMVQPKEFIEFIEIDLKCNFEKVAIETARLIALSDKELDLNGDVIGKVIGIGKSRPYQNEFNLGGSEAMVKIVKEAVGLVEVPVTLKLKAGIKSGSLYYKDNKIAVNSPIEFKTDKYTVRAIIEEEQSQMAEGIEKINLNIILKDLDLDTLKLISVGDKEIDKHGDVVTEILQIGKIENNIYDIDLGQGSFTIGEDRNKKQVSVRMGLKCNIVDGKLYFKETRIKINSPIEFKTDKYTVRGVVAKSYEAISSPLGEKWVEVKLKFQELIPEISKILSAGDIEKEPTGKTVGRLKTVIKNEPSIVLTLKEEKIIPISHPFYRDIVVTLGLLCIEKDGILYFKNYPVKIGNAIIFSTELYSIQGIIIGIGNK